VSPGHPAVDIQTQKVRRERKKEEEETKESTFEERIANQKKSNAWSEHLGVTSPTGSSSGGIAVRL